MGQSKQAKGDKDLNYHREHNTPRTQKQNEKKQKKTNKIGF